jgi:hypothetical protein
VKADPTKTSLLQADHGIQPAGAFAPAAVVTTAAIGRVLRVKRNRQLGRVPHDCMGELGYILEIERLETLSPGSYAFREVLECGGSAIAVAGLATFSPGLIVYRSRTAPRFCSSVQASSRPSAGRVI